MNPALFERLVGEKGITLSPLQLEQFDVYYHFLVEWNERINLTSITDVEGVYAKHFFDSISASFYYPFDRPLRLVDVGAGAGFPSIPLKICFPQLEITIVDSLRKRIDFLHLLVEKLGIEGVSLYHDRAESFGQRKEHRQVYDLAISRAVARLSVLTEFCLPLVRVGGHFLAMKGLKGTEELDEARNAIRILGGETGEVYDFQLPEDEGKRYIIQIAKSKNTPKNYPRKPGVPLKQPLL